MSQQLRALLGDEKKVEENVPLEKYTKFQIGGPARWLVHAKSADALVSVARFSQENKIPLLLLSGGANVLVSDNGWPGIAMMCEDRRLEINGERVSAASGVPLGYLARQTAEQGLVGAEFCASIPGAVGGAVYGNAGAFGSEMKDIVEHVEIWDGEHRRVLNNSQCQFGYRSSSIKAHNQQSSPLWIVLSARLKLQKGETSVAQETIRRFLEKKARQQSLEKPSAGCLFKNLVIGVGFWDDPSHAQWKKDVPPEMLVARVISSAWLIDRAELKGFSIGRAQVSAKHGNFVLNMGGATAEDVMMLISIIKQKIRSQFGVQLEEEVALVGF